MYAVISLPLESRTLATLRSAEFGFLGVIVLTWRQTPRLNGQASSTGDLVLYTTGRRGLRTSWLIVGMCRSMDPARSRPGCLSLRVGWSRLQGIQAHRRPTTPKHVMYHASLICQAEVKIRRPGSNSGVLQAIASGPVS